MMKKVIFLFVISILFLARSATAFNLPELDTLYEEYKACKKDKKDVEADINRLKFEIEGYEEALDMWRNVAADDEAAEDAPREIAMLIDNINEAEVLIEVKLQPFAKKAEDFGKKVVTLEPEILIRYKKEVPYGQPETTQPETTQPETIQPETTQPKTIQPETTQPKTVQPKVTPKIDKKETDYSGDFFATPKDDSKSPYQVEGDTKKHFYDKKPKSPRTPSEKADHYKGIDEALGDL